MNLLAKKIGTGIIVMLVLFLSCEDPSDIGVVVTPDDQVGVFFKEFPVNVTTTLVGEIDTRTTGGFRGLVGAYQDPDFGFIKSKMNLQFIPERFKVVSSQDDTLGLIPDTAIYLSAKLIIKAPEFNSINFGEDQTFQVFRVHDDLLLDSIYKSTDTITVIDPNTMLPDLIGEETFQFTFIEDSIEQLELSIELTPEFGMELMTAAQESTNGDGIYGTFDNFKEVFKGISIAPVDNNNIIFGIDPIDTENNIELSYTIVGDTTIDTLTFAHPLYSSSQLLAGFSNYEVDRTGTPLQDLALHEDLPNDNGKAYLQAGTGVIMRFNFDSVAEFFKPFELIQLNRAEIFMKDVQQFSGNDNEFNAPGFLAYLYSDSTNLFITEFDSIVYSNELTSGRAVLANDLLVPTDPGGANRSLAFFRDADNTYSTVSTLNFQNFIDSPEDVDNINFLDEDFDYLIVPLQFSDNFNRIVVDKADITVRVYYTTLKE